MKSTVDVIRRRFDADVERFSTRWLAQQPEDTLLRLYAGLAKTREHTLVIRTNEEWPLAATHYGPVVVRDGEDWFDYCENLCILDDVTDVLGRRLYSAAAGRSAVEVVAGLPPDGFGILSDWQHVFARKVGLWGRLGGRNRAPHPPDTAASRRCPRPQVQW